MTGDAAVLGELDNRFTTATTDIELPGGTVTLVHPRNADDLITEADYVRDERLPYWADIWPSSRALARAMAGLTPKPGRLLELGCGLAGEADDERRTQGHAGDGRSHFLNGAKKNVGASAALHALQHCGGRMLQRHIDVGANFFVSGNRFQQPASNFIGIGI